MAIGVIFEFPGMTRAKYRQTAKKVLRGRRNRLSSWPVKGVLAHIAGPMPGGWRVVDVWTSRAAFKRFGKFLMPIMKDAGMRKVKPKIFPVAKFIKT